MKRARTAAVVAALGLTLALTGAVVARNPHAGTHGGGHAATKTHSHGPKADTTVTKGPKAKDAGPTTITTTLWASGNTSHPGGTFRVFALVHTPVASRPETVDAVVHFASGDAAVVLTHNGEGKGVSYHGTAVVPDAEPSGKVQIDVSATVGANAVTGTGWGAVVAQDGTDGADETDTTDETNATDATAAGEDQSEDADASPEPGDSPDADQDAEGDQNEAQGDVDGDAGQPQVNAEFVKALLAYLQTLVD